MARNILILGASYGSLLATKLLMAGHNVTLVCRKKTAELINRDGTEVRIKLRDEAVHRAIVSRGLPGKLDATTPGEGDVSRYDLAGPRGCCAARPARKTGRHSACRSRRLPLRPGGARDAGAAIRQPHHPRAHDQ